ncbi:MAG: transcription elongation factor GreA [Oscillospiraceae bacterium]|nr:transcription elongation factor GreA [Oscillospiraceae bacterium]
MANKKVILTDEGLKKLEKELEQLKTVKRKEVAEKIKVALSFGDLSENSEYDEAKNEQAMVEARIMQLDSILKNVKVLDESQLNTESINIGCKILLKDIEENIDVNYHLVGSTETDPTNGRISDESPVGKALLTHKVGDIVEIETPGGMSSFEVLNISK